jgi:hypothetical protein
MGLRTLRYIETVILLASILSDVSLRAADKADEVGSATPVGVATPSGLTAASDASSHAQAPALRMSVGFLYPGLSFRYSFNRVAVEAIYLSQDHLNAVGPRLYYFFNPGSRTVFSAGVEVCRVGGKTNLQTVSGRSMMAFAGIEFAASRRVSVGMDMGPCKVDLNGANGATANQTTLVANIDARLHF